MNDLKTLDEFGRTLDPDTAVPPARLRHRVLTEARHPHGRFRAPRFTAPRFGWRMAAVGGMAAVLTAGVLVTQVVPMDGQAPASSASAAERILAGAAAQAQRQPAVTVRGNQFVYIESIATALSRNEAEPGPGTSRPTQRQIWLSADGTRDGLLRERPRGGAGDWDETPLPGCRDGKSVATKYGKTAEVECTPTPGHHADVPTDADAMLVYLYAKGAGTKNPRDQQAFTAAGDLIREAYLSPASLAAVFTAVAKIPGVRVVGDVTDEAGRAGVALALNEVQGFRTELIFDRQSYAYLGERSVVVRDQDGMKAGQTINSAAVLTVAVVSSAGQLPK
ncbi:CU044_5270 family protein [Micromonospora sp. NBC_00858]|uniref:CU044_5270 family protein n=1 Tax=Micromonospora sp. NBC_00858 TaxID=2975979 RepID=UPI003864D714|nr:CU044_5270 family protein [Micromonospora sp. NBC_00858]